MKKIKLSTSRTNNVSKNVKSSANFVRKNVTLTSYDELLFKYIERNIKKNNEI